MTDHKASDGWVKKVATAAGLVRVWRPGMGDAPAAWWWVRPEVRDAWEVRDAD